MLNKKIPNFVMYELNSQFSFYRVEVTVCSMCFKVLRGVWMCLFYLKKCFFKLWYTMTAIKYMTHDKFGYF